MPKLPGEIGIGVSRLYAIQQVVRDWLPALQTDLETNAVTQRFVMAPYTGLRAEQVDIGELGGIWNPQSGAFRFRVTAGVGYQNATDAQIQNRYLTGINNKEAMFFTSLTAYIHGDCWRTTDIDLQKREQEILRVAVLDWSRMVFTPGQNPDTGYDSRVLRLTSREYDPHGSGDPQYDELYECLITSTTLGMTLQSFSGGQVVYGVQMTHQGKIAG